MTVDYTIEEVTYAYFTHLGDLEEDSPYTEVRSAVADIDDPDMPCNTIRVWILGVIMATVIPGFNQFCASLSSFSVDSTHSGEMIDMSVPDWLNSVDTLLPLSVVIVRGVISCVSSASHLCILC